jgi:hypothetical protein
MKTIIATAVAVAIGLLSTPTFAGSYVVNGHAASPAETQLLVSHGVQPGQWVVDGYGISPARDEHVIPTTSGSQRNCRYVLDVLLCD